jgi:hypothetical protein
MKKLLFVACLAASGCIQHVQPMAPFRANDIGTVDVKTVDRESVEYSDMRAKALAQMKYNNDRNTAISESNGTQSFADCIATHAKGDRLGCHR